MRDSLQATGHLKVHKNGILVRDIRNLIVTTGLDWLTARLIDTGIPDEMSHMHMGTGGAATRGLVTGTVDLTGGTDFSVINQSFFIDVNNGEFTKEVTLTANCADLAAIVAEINLQLTAASVEGVEAVESTTFVQLQTTSKGAFSQFFISEPDANSFLATAGLEDGTYAGTGGATMADTDLTTPHADPRTALTSTTVTANQIEFLATFAPGVCTGALTEAGVFNALAAGTMSCRTVFDTVNKGASDSITLTWKWVIQ